MTSTPESGAPEGAVDDTSDDTVEVPAVTAETDETDAPVEAEAAEVVVVESDAEVEAVVIEADAEVEAVVVEEADVEVVEVEPDPRLFAAHDLALAALHEITPPSTVGPAADYAVEPGGAVSLRFQNRLPGYPGWYWTVTLAAVEDAEPTVLEVELMPGAGALLAPEWVPWATRLAEYHTQQAALAEAAGTPDADDAAEDADEESDEDEFEDADASDFDEDGSSILHAGDVDGVDIDELDEDAADDDSDDDSDGDDDSDDDDSDDSDDDDSDDDDDSNDDDSDDESDDDDSDDEDVDSDEDDSDDPDYFDEDRSY